ncbi:MAG: acyl-ACP--UDP-N-acetylglucosamine O-acyltransferase [Armatimonadota bacterium]|nr:acyl-ACP--UDP-N-acetylglucosamine O-acyltransferase [Armatimonadota bacterium]MDR7426450.1 acyl-ACP--UDP-N-acetylglucosamine O-acyltransferase [Armatimonadota bacterium]MDR7464687.1 acyl-ACP--UDP-N-acetylglucosamine O-acyltransferase [Armatimonadota bacterium]MDR7538420.1 acyl-ACP--UDP-N-acetylglucosamine O-acyltransferase [Armatimonadota bacterium]
MEVHPTAVVHPGARLHPGVVVGPYAVVGSDVVVGPGTRIGPHVVIEDGVRIGMDNEISSGATLGTIPQDRHFQGERSYLVIGDRNRIREYVNISRATGEGAATVVGNECLIMCSAHIGHNCRLGDRVVVVNGVQMAGHVQVDDGAYIGGMTGIHQFVHIGRLAMIGGFSLLRQDCPPFMLAEGRPARCRSLNRVGLQRQGISAGDRAVLRRAFRILYQSALGLGQALERLQAELGDHPLVGELVAFLRAARERPRGVVRWASGAE